MGNKVDCRSQTADNQHLVASDLAKSFTRHHFTALAPSVKNSRRPAGDIFASGSGSQKVGSSSPGFSRDFSRDRDPEEYSRSLPPSSLLQTQSDSKFSDSNTWQTWTSPQLTTMSPEENGRYGRPSNPTIHSGQNCGWDVVPFYEVSALTGEGINEAFDLLARQARERFRIFY